MFDVNFIKKPGLQSADSKNNLEENSTIKKVDKIVVESTGKKNKSKLWYLLVIVVFLLFGIYIYILVSNGRNPLFDKKYKVDMVDIIEILKKHNNSIVIENLDYNNNFNIKIKTLNKESFYDLMNNMTIYFDSNVRGANINNIYTINVDLSNENYKKAKITVDELSKELADFNIDINQELYDEKLILVLDRFDMFILMDFLKKLNLINNYRFNIQLIKDIESNIELYQMIIE